MDKTIRHRIQEWHGFIEENGIGGRLFGEPVDYFVDTLKKAYEIAIAALNDGLWQPERVICTTFTAAMGLRRALHEKHLNTGSDVRICAVGGEDWGEYLTPSLTSVTQPDLNKLINRALNMLEHDDHENALLKPEKIEIFIGESS